MPGWIVPPQKEPTKTKADFAEAREHKVQTLIEQGYLQSQRIIDALLTVPREIFIPREYRDYAYREVPLPLPGKQATISCPHSYPLFYEPLGLDANHRFLEIGLGSGYGAAVAQEVVGENGLVVSVEIDPLTFDYAKRRLEQANYTDVVLVHADGGLGHAALSPYDRIAVTAACPQVPPPLIAQLNHGGKLIAPLLSEGGQELVLIEKRQEGLKQKSICEVLYVKLQGEYGV
ncbi:MAG: protein-L-isoaspartate O-methyltransferase [Anaerolineales bacterium]|nr:protein-L-isoaspartate O-methyltransferase [Anaerolineales bacterium]